MKKVEQDNDKLFMDLLAKSFPDLWAIEVFRQELEIKNIEWIKSVMRGVAFVAGGTGYGNVTIEIKNGEVYLIYNKEIDNIEKRFYP